MSNDANDESKAAEVTVDEVKKQGDEEVVDVSKPLAKVDRPSKDVLDRQIEVHEETIKKLEDTRAALTSKIDAINNKAKDSALGAARAEFSRLKAVKQTIMKERGVIFDRRDLIKAQTENLISDATKAKGAIKYTRIEDIEKRIRELNQKQSTTSMSLSEEKKLVKELEELSASKKTVAALASKEDGISASKLEAKDIKGAIAEKNKELTAINEQLDAQKAVVDGLAEKEQGTRSAIPDLFKERDAVRAKINDEKKAIKKAREVFKRDNNLWYAYQKQARAIRQIQYEEEKKRREEEKAQWLKEKEEEELKKTPYEEEMALCEYLANFLTTTYLDGAAATPAAKPEKAEVKIANDPFAGFAPTNKKGDDTFMKMGKGSKQEKISSKPAKAKKAAKEVPFNLSIDTYDQFALINLTPPMALNEVAAKVAELKEKQIWFTKQERGSVETAADIRKKQQNAAKKLEKKAEKEEGGDVEKKVEKKAAKAFTLNDDDFAPLGNAAVAATDVSWGKKEEKKEEPTDAADPVA